jgi:hypothetical protein
MKYSVSLGITLNMGNFNSVRAEITTGSDDYMEAFEESRAKLFDAAYHLAKEVEKGLGPNATSDNAIGFLASKLTEEPRV